MQATSGSSPDLFVLNDMATTQIGHSSRQVAAQAGQRICRNRVIAIAHRLHAHVSHDLNVSLICYIYIAPSTAGAQTPADLRLRLVHCLIQSS